MNIQHKNQINTPEQTSILRGNDEIKTVITAAKSEIVFLGPLIFSYCPEVKIEITIKKQNLNKLKKHLGKQQWQTISIQENYRGALR